MHPNTWSFSVVMYDTVAWTRRFTSSEVILQYVWMNDVSQGTMMHSSGALPFSAEALLPEISSLLIGSRGKSKSTGRASRIRFFFCIFTRFTVTILPEILALEGAKRCVLLRMLCWQLIGTRKLLLTLVKSLLSTCAASNLCLNDVQNSIENDFSLKNAAQVTQLRSRDPAIQPLFNNKIIIIVV